jgi:hypothetical protein
MTRVRITGMDLDLDLDLDLDQRYWQIVILSLFNDPANPIRDEDKRMPYDPRNLVLQKVIQHPLSGYIICLAATLRPHVINRYR